MTEVDHAQNDRKVIVSYKDVKKAFGDNVVLNDLNLNVHEGEKVALIGLQGLEKRRLFVCS